MRCLFLQHSHWSLARGYISTIFVYILPRLHTLNINRSNKRKCFIPQTLTYAHYVDNIAHLTNRPDQVESLQHSWAQAARVIGCYVTELRCFKQKGAISSLSGQPLKLVHQFTYLRSKISSTESNVNICLAEMWNAIDKVIDHMEDWSIKSNKTGFLPSCRCPHTTIWMHHIDTNEMHWEKVRL